MGAIECRVFNPLPQIMIMAQLTSDAKTETSRVGIHKAGGISPKAAVTVDEAYTLRPHFPGLLNYSCQADIVWMIPV